MKITDGDDECEARLEAADGVIWVRLLWSDSAGLRRCRVVPSSRLKQVYSKGVGLASGCLALQAWGDKMAPESGLGPVGEVRLVPDIATFRRLPWHPTHGIALADMLQDAPGHEPSDAYWECCPRNALRKVIRLARERYGIGFRVGFESEFVLLRDAPGAPADSALPHAIDSSVYCQSSAFDAAAPVLDAMTHALSELGIEVEQVHAESAGGQFEIATAHELALTAADNLLLTREAIVGVARKAGLLASFMPKLAPDEAGSGAHCHISLHNLETLGPIAAGTNMVAHVRDTGKADSGGPGVIAACFAAGMLRYLPALMAWTLPSAASHARIQPACWSGAYRIWGVDNREAPLRLCVNAGPASRNWEFRSLDATANPHLALSALIAAGCAGIQNGWQLPAPCNEDPAGLPHSERLPESLSEAIHSFENPPEGCPGLRPVLVEALGAPLVDAFMAVRRGEEAHFRECEPSQLVQELITRF